MYMPIDDIQKAYQARQKKTMIGLAIMRKESTAENFIALMIFMMGVAQVN